MQRTSARSVRVFAYGTLTFPEVMRAVTGRCFPGRPARLEGYACLCLRGRAYPGVLRRLGAATDGIVYEINATSLARIRDFEDDCYETKLLPVTLTGSPDAGSPAVMEALVFCLRAGQERALSTVPWDRDAFARRHLAAFLLRCDSRGRKPAPS